MTKTKRIEEIQAKIKELSKELTENVSIMTQLRERSAWLDREIKALKRTLNSFRPENLVVSDHAVLRYAERHFKIDFHAIKKEIEEKLKGAEAIGDFKALGFVVKGNTVITYTGDI